MPTPPRPTYAACRVTVDRGNHKPSMTGSDHAQLTLFSVPTCVYCHRARLVLAEKDARVRIVDIDPDEPSDELAAVSPELRVPTLVDRGASVFGARTLVEYLDERYPYPPLLPVDPLNRARVRMMLDYIETRAYPLAEAIELGEGSAVRQKRELADWLTLIVADLAEQRPSGSGLSLIDTSLAPLLWRVGEFGLPLGSKSRKAGDDRWQQYAARLFERPAFYVSLSSAEARMSPALAR